MGGVLADKLTSKRWLVLLSRIYCRDASHQFDFIYTVLLLVGLFIWNIVQWTNHAIQSGIIDVEGDTSQVMVGICLVLIWYWFGGIIRWPCCFKYEC